MFDMLKGLNSVSLPGQNGLEGKGVNPAEAGAPGEFEALLKGSEAESNILPGQEVGKQEDLMSVLTGKFKADAKDSTEARIAKSGQDDLMGVLNSSEAPSEKIAKLKAMLESGAITEEQVVDADLTTVDPKVIQTILGGINQEGLTTEVQALGQKTDGPLVMKSAQSNQALEQVAKENPEVVMSKGESKVTGEEKFDHRLMQLATPKKFGADVKPVQNQAMSLHSSQEFLTQHGANKPHVVSQKHAFNMFQKEQSVLGNDGIIKKKSMTDFNKFEAKSDSLQPEKMTSKEDNLNVFETQTNDILKPSAKVEGSVSIVSKGTDTQVIDLSSVQNKDQIISEITKYIETSKVQNGRELELVVTHKDLGQFKVNAQKSGNGELVDLKIVTSTNEGNNFFNQQETNLLKTLHTNGVKVSDIKISMNSAENHSSGNNSAGQNNSGNGQGFARDYSSGGHGSHDQGKQRRQELWDQYKERLGA
ncbi:hypothetical protein [Bacteriovorax sp. Seq25_V]|uniref:hypothetical protein n=1 Tax=Bacteriovorax sp. Seq25_V TaxID=1201288 RepID=UPI00038A0BEC|nr:hypothetical protein [Bacteriovorax sp. Seq25_V]EQC45417.1 hypothetical protein M900_2317 [Bacteriovorax sp. Seq25_V]